jgi:hypothetical protein
VGRKVRVVELPEREEPAAVAVPEREEPEREEPARAALRATSIAARIHAMRASFASETRAIAA